MSVAKRDFNVDQIAQRLMMYFQSKGIEAESVVSVRVAFQGLSPELRVAIENSFLNADCDSEGLNINVSDYAPNILGEHELDENISTFERLAAKQAEIGVPAPVE